MNETTIVEEFGDSKITYLRSKKIIIEERYSPSEMKTGYLILFSMILFLLMAFGIFLTDEISRALSLEEVSSFVKTFLVPISIVPSALLLILVVYYQISLATGRYMMDGIRRTILDKEESIVLIEDERRGEVKPKERYSLSNIRGVRINVSQPAILVRIHLESPEGPIPLIPLGEWGETPFGNRKKIELAHRISELLGIPILNKDNSDVTILEKLVEKQKRDLHENQNLSSEVYKEISNTVVNPGVELSTQVSGISKNYPINIKVNDNVSVYINDNSRLVLESRRSSFDKDLIGCLFIVVTIPLLCLLNHFINAFINNVENNIIKFLLITSIWFGLSFLVIYLRNKVVERVPNNILDRVIIDKNKMIIRLETEEKGNLKLKAQYNASIVRNVKVIVGDYNSMNVCLDCYPSSDIYVIREEEVPDNAKKLELAHKIAEVLGVPVMEKT